MKDSDLNSKKHNYPGEGMLIKLRFFLFFLLICFCAMCDDLRIEEIKNIYCSEESSGTARLLAKKLKEYRDIDPEIKTECSDPEAGGIFLGRKAALFSGIITEKELEEVKPDGYVIKASADRATIAGYSQQGNVYGIWRFLKECGLDVYPWHYHDKSFLELFSKPEKIKELNISFKPFFDYRNFLSYLDRGRFGALLSEYGIGNFNDLQKHEYFQGKGWLGSDHTAPYLVPMAKYAKEHPEYFAVRRGRRLPLKTKNARVSLCLSNPDVYDISAERAMDWIKSQEKKRFFHITDGDAKECECDACLEMDILPGVVSDRYLKWVNHIARKVKDKYPGKKILALAYADSIEPPVEVKPESNVIVLYCPWYWNSRGTSATGWDNPLSVTAMKEFMEWQIKFPHNTGVYDYPGPWVFGLAERIKFLAKNDVRYYYACGGNGDRFQWIGSNLLGNPFLNTSELDREFTQAEYGPAASLIFEYFQIYRDAIEKGFRLKREAAKGPEFNEKVLDICGKVREKLETVQEQKTKLRIILWLKERYRDLAETAKESGAIFGESSEELKKTYIKLLRKAKDFYLGGKIWKERSYTCRRALRDIDKDLKKAEKKNIKAEDSIKQTENSGSEEIFDRTQSGMEEAKKKSAAEKISLKSAGRIKTILFSDEDKWLSDGTEAELIKAPAEVEYTAPDGSVLKGVRIDAALEKLPYIKVPGQPLDTVKFHAGRFYAERKFEKPFDSTGLPFIQFHIYSSEDILLTAYIDRCRSDFDLKAGENIIRMDMKNFVNSRFNYADWDKKISRISFDIYPQDCQAPYNRKVKDTSLYIFSMILSNIDPSPSTLPHKGKAIWISQFRPNLTFQMPFKYNKDPEFQKYILRQHYKHVGGDRGSRWFHEKFRTFTPFRIISPVYSIITSEETEKQNADRMSEALRQAFGIELKRETLRTDDIKDKANCIMIGREAALASGMARRKEFDYAGQGGFVINASSNLIAIGGNCEKSTGFGIASYLESLGFRFLIPGRLIHVPELRNSFLNELYLIDFPYFKERNIPGGWMLKTDMRPGNKPIAEISSELKENARATALKIKELARRGKGQTTPEFFKTPLDPLSNYLAAKLLWDPFADSSRLIREWCLLVENQKKIDKKLNSRAETGAE